MQCPVKSKVCLKIVSIVGYWPQTVGHSAFFRFFKLSSSCSEHISVSGQYVKLIGDFSGTKGNAPCKCLHALPVFRVSCCASIISVEILLRLKAKRSV